MDQRRTLHLWLLVIAAVLVALTMAYATGAGIQDAAGFFRQEAITTAEQHIAAIHKKFGKDLRVETYDRIPPDRAAQYTPEKRTEFFATWAYQRAKALGLDGVIVLICKDPAFLQVEVGDRTQQHAFTLAHRDQMRDLLVAAFTQRHFDDGLQQAVAYFGKTLQSTLGASGTGSRPSPAPAPEGHLSRPAPQESQPRTPQINRSLLWLLGIVVVGGVGLWFLFRRRRGPSEYRDAQSNSGYAPYDDRGAPPGMGYPPPDSRYGGGGGGFGRGFGGGILGGLLGGWLGNRLAQRDVSASQDASSDAYPRTPSGGGGFDASPGPDFSGDEPADVGGGGDFGAEQGGNDEQGGGGSF